MELDAIVVGAGFAGLYALHRLRSQGLTARVLEAAEDIGGTWYWNRYPGARCDVESLQYSYQFDPQLEQDWAWSERYAAQPEILAYLNHVADRYDLRRDIRLDTRVEAASFDEAAGRWRVRTSDGAEASARWLVMATGCLSRPNKPSVEGLERFQGRVLHTGEWPHEGVDLAGLTVGVVGTGSSAVQAIPMIAREARRLVVFQRTATYTVPARNRPLAPEEQGRVKADYRGYRANWNSQPAAADFDIQPVSVFEVSPEQRRAAFEQRWAYGGAKFGGVFNDLGVTLEANQIAADYVRGKIAEIVTDPATAERLTPRHTFACKRLCFDTDYYATFNRPNVELVDVKADPIARFDAAGLVTASGARFELDAVVFATGFDAMTGSLNAIDIRGRHGELLKDAWAAGPRSYLGLMIAGFPNLFTVSGPGSPSVLTNMVPSIEQHVEWIARCIADVDARGGGTIEASPEAQDAWVDEVNALAAGTLFPTCNSWYLGANVPGKPRVFMPYVGGFPAYRERCEAVAANGYEGFLLGRALAEA